MTTTDLIIIGAGPGGYHAAEYAARQGLKVVVFEGAEVGGTCLNVGCIPTKTFVHSPSFTEARERMGLVVPLLRQGVEGILSHPNITLVRSTASFVDGHTVSCAEGDTFTADNIIVATGSETKLIPVEGLDNPRVVDSTSLLQLEKLPRKLCIIGAGVIGMEFASVFHRFGSEVTVIEFLKECLPAIDSDIAKRLRKLMEKRGIRFQMKTAVKSLNDIDADIILMATGRKPRTEGLNLTAAGITLAPNGAIAVDDNFQVLVQSTHNATPGSVRDMPNANSHIYAIGDVNGRQMLAHAAEIQALHAVNHIVGKTDGIRFDIMPAAVFTTPEAACVGPTEEQLKASQTAYECKKAFWRANGRAQAMGEMEGMLKLFYHTDGHILGCHAYGEHAAEVVQEISVLMCRDTTIDQLHDMVHIHPTISEVLINT